MSVGDIRGFRRRQKQAAARGHMPKRSYVTISDAISQNRAMAARLAKIGSGKKK